MTVNLQTVKVSGRQSGANPGPEARTLCLATPGNIAIFAQVPPYALTAVALFGSAVPMSWRRGLARAAGVLLVVVGLVTFARGLGGHEGRAGMDSNPHARHHSP